MKHPLVLLSITALVFAFAACVTQAKLQYYEFPTDITEEARTGNLKNIEKGRVLYNLNCAKCHNKKEKGKILLPDFTNEQLDMYKIRIKNEQHVNALPEDRVTIDELESIQFFFAYKKPSRPVPEN